MPLISQRWCALRYTFINVRVIWVPLYRVHATHCYRLMQLWVMIHDPYDNFEVAVKQISRIVSRVVKEPKNVEVANMFCFVWYNGIIINILLNNYT